MTTRLDRLESQRRQLLDLIAEIDRGETDGGGFRPDELARMKVRLGDINASVGMDVQTPRRPRRL
jgi:hypothetical protein